MNINAVNQFIGKDWVYRDNDCWAVFRNASLAVFGVEIHELEIPNESDPAKNSVLFDDNSKQPEWVKIDNPEPGCAVLFKTRRGIPVHIGLHIINGDVLHCPGTIEKPGRTSYDHITALKKIYRVIEFYRYVPNNRNQ